RLMTGGTLFTLMAAAIVVWRHPGAWPVALPLIAAWLLAPAIARRASRPGTSTRAAPLSPAERRALELVARQTWTFFTTFVTAESNHLPPDNFQETPQPVVAQRTSPTNIGLYLLASVAAYDFAWIAAPELVDRVGATLHTMGTLEHHRGHLFNWYDTRDLRALEPKYVSSVDSGNLAGHLIAIANACKEWRQSPTAAASRKAGIADTHALTVEQAVHLGLGPRTQTVTPRQLEESLAAMTKTLSIAASSEEALATQLSELAAEAAIVVDIASAIALERSDGSGSDLL